MTKGLKVNMTTLMITQIQNSMKVSYGLVIPTLMELIEEHDFSTRNIKGVLNGKQKNRPDL